MRSIPFQPILYKQVPALDAALLKLVSFIDKSCNLDKAALKRKLYGSIVPYLKAPNTATKPSPDINRWVEVTQTLIDTLSPAELFPIIDFWRLALLEPRFARLSVNASDEPFKVLLNTATKSLNESTTLDTGPRNFYITILRMFSNGFATLELSRHLMKPSLRPLLTQIVVPSLLHSDPAVRSAAAGLTFNMVSHQQSALVDFYRNGNAGDPVPDTEGEGGGDWETEVVTAILESLNKETQSEEVGKNAF